MNLPGHGQKLIDFSAAVIIFIFWLSSDQTSWRRWIFFFYLCLGIFYSFHKYIFISLFLFNFLYITFFFSKFVIKVASTVVHVKIYRKRPRGWKRIKSREVEDNGYVESESERKKINLSDKTGSCDRQVYYRVDGFCNCSCVPLNLTLIF